MSITNAFSHLTLEERRIILTGITNGSTKTTIAQTIGKEKSRSKSHGRYCWPSPKTRAISLSDNRER